MTLSGESNVDPRMAKHALWLSVDELAAVVVGLELGRHNEVIPERRREDARRVENMAAALLKESGA